MHGYSASISPFVASLKRLGLKRNFTDSVKHNSFSPGCNTKTKKRDIYLKHY